jgi:hypothetical protein
MDKKVLLFERSEFQHFPIFCPAQLGTRRAVAAWSPFFAYFLWRSKESEWLSGHTRPTGRRSTTKQSALLKILTLFSQRKPIPIPTFPLKGKEYGERSIRYEKNSIYG